MSEGIDPATAALTLDGLRVRWPRAGADTLDIERLHMQRGERVLLPGDSGCGKSTLLSLAAGVLVPQAGQVCLLGQDWRVLAVGRRDRVRADQIGYIFQQFNLLVGTRAGRKRSPPSRPVPSQRR